MKTINEDGQVATLRGNQGEYLVLGNWRQKDEEWGYLDAQIECHWYMAILSIEFSFEKLKEFHEQLQSYEQLLNAEFYPEYGDFFSLSLSLKNIGNSVVKGNGSAKYPFLTSASVSYDFEVELASVTIFSNQIENLVKRSY